MHSSPQFILSALLGKFTWVRAIVFGGKTYGGGQLFSRKLSRGGGAINREAIIQEGNYPGGNFPWR